MGLGLPKAEREALQEYSVTKDRCPVKDEGHRAPANQIGSVGGVQRRATVLVGTPSHRHPRAIRSKTLQYSESDNTVVASHVDKQQSAYAMFKSHGSSGRSFQPEIELSGHGSAFWDFPLSEHSVGTTLFAGGRALEFRWKACSEFPIFWPGPTFTSQ